MLNYRSFFIVGFLSVLGAFPALAGIWSSPKQCSGTFCTDEYLAMGSLPKINAADAYEMGFTGKGVTVAVVDMGVRLTHREFAGKLSPLQTTYLNPTMDDHGTHVAGTILGARDGLGMHGVAFDASLLSFQAKISNIISNFETDETFEELAKDKYNHIKIINNSWGYTNTVLEDHPGGLNSRIFLPMKKLTEKDKLMIFGAGNDAKETSIYPGAYASIDGYLKLNVINVVSYDNLMRPDSSYFLAYYSNSARGSESYTIAAPGGVMWDNLSGIYSATHSGDSAYEYLQGTSMAAPHVSGVAALVQEAFPYMGGKQIADVILSTADNDFSTLSDKFFKMGDILNSEGEITGISFIHVFITDNKTWTPAEKDAFVQEFNFGTACGVSWQPENEIKCVEMTYAEVFGQGFLDAAAAVKGPKYLDASRLRETAYQDQDGFSAPSDYISDFSFDGQTAGQFFYTVDTLGFDSRWSHDIGEKPSSATGFETASVGLKKQGQGRLVLTGNNTFAGVSVIEGGVLEIAGSLAAGVQVNGGELYLNNGAVNGSVLSSAAVSFAGLPSVDALKISGGSVDLKTASVNVDSVLSFNTASAGLSVTIGADGYGRFTGSAVPEFTVSPVLNVFVDKAASLAAGDDFTFFDSAANGNVTPGYLSNNLYTFEETQKGTYTLAKTLSVAEFALQGGASGDMGNAARMLTQNHFANGRLETVSNLLFETAQNGTPQQLARAVASVTPDEQNSVKKASAEGAKSLFQSVSSRVSAVSGRSGGEAFQSAGMWGKYLYNYTQASGAFNCHSKGFLIGADAETENGVLAGIGYAFTDTDLKTSFDGRKTEISNHAFFGYGQYQAEILTYEASASYTYGRIKEDKAFSADKYNTDQLAAQILAKHGTDVFMPAGGMRYIWTHEESRTDDLGQFIQSSDNALLTVLGGAEFSKNTGRVNLSGGAFLTYDVLSDSDTVQVVLPNGAGYAVAGGRSPRLGAEVFAQTDFRLNNKTVLSLEYAATFKKEYQSHTGMLKLRYDF